MIVTSTDLPHTNTAGILRDPVALVTGGTRGNGAGAGYPGQRYTVLEARHMIRLGNRAMRSHG